MGARAGWRWISVVVMGRRFPVRLSLRSARYVLQDKRRRVRITRAVPVRCTVVGVFLFQFRSIDDLDLAENLCDRGHTSFIKSAVEQYIAAGQQKPDRSSAFVFLYLISMYETFFFSLYIYVHAFCFVKAFFDN